MKIGFRVQGSGNVGAIRRVALWDEFDFLIVCMIVVMAFALGIILGGRIVEKKLAGLQAGQLTGIQVTKGGQGE